MGFERLAAVCRKDAALGSGSYRRVPLNNREVDHGMGLRNESNWLKRNETEMGWGGVQSGRCGCNLTHACVRFSRSLDFETLRLCLVDLISHKKVQ